MKKTKLTKQQTVQVLSILRYAKDNVKRPKMKGELMDEMIKEERVKFMKDKTALDMRHRLFLRDIEEIERVLDPIDIETFDSNDIIVTLQTPKESEVSQTAAALQTK